MDASSLSRVRRDNGKGRRILDSGTLVCPTQTVWESALFYLEPGDDRQNLLQHVPIGAVRSHLFSYLYGLERDTLLRVQARQRTYLSALIQAGGEIVAGTDTPCQLALPGISLIDELLLYHACGMSSENAIASATEIPADKFGIPAGRLQKGKRADIIAVRGNPLQQLADLRDTQVVYKAGRRFEAKELRNRDLSLETGGCLPVFHRAADYAEPMRSIYPEFFH